MKALKFSLLIFLLFTVIVGCNENDVVENHTISYKVENKGIIKITPNQNKYKPGTEITVEAKPQKGYKFKKWEGNLSGTKTKQTLVIDRDMYIIAEFTKKDKKIKTADIPKTIEEKFNKQNELNYSINFKFSKNKKLKPLPNDIKTEKLVLKDNEPAILIPNSNKRIYPIKPEENFKKDKKASYLVVKNHFKDIIDINELPTFLISEKNLCCREA